MFEDMDVMTDADHEVFMADAMYESEVDDLMDTLNALEGEG